MPHRLLDRIRAYFDAAGPLIGREWPIRYRQDEEQRLEILRGFGAARASPPWRIRTSRGWPRA